MGSLLRGCVCILWAFHANLDNKTTNTESHLEAMIQEM